MADVGVRSKQGGTCLFWPGVSSPFLIGLRKLNLMLRGTRDWTQHRSGIKRNFRRSEHPYSGGLRARDHEAWKGCRSHTHVLHEPIKYTDIEQQGEINIQWQMLLFRVTKGELVYPGWDITSQLFDLRNSKSMPLDLDDKKNPGETYVGSWFDPGKDSRSHRDPGCMGSVSKLYPQQSQHLWLLGIRVLMRGGRED